MGTLVSYGRGRGVVVSTGMHTEIGLIATMIQSFQEEPTPLQRKLDQLGKLLGMGGAGGVRHRLPRRLGARLPGRWTCF